MDFLSMIMDNLGLIIMIGFCFMFMVKFMLPFLGIFQSRRRTYIEKATDAHEAIYRKLKKSAKLNMRDQPVRRIWLDGDDYHRPTYLGRVYGIIPDRPVSTVYVQSRRFGAVRLLPIPFELTYGWMARDLHVDALGVQALGNFYRLVWPTGRKDDVWYYDQLVLDWEEAVLGLEKCVEIEEYRVHSISDSTKMTTRDRMIIDRGDVPARVPAPAENRMEAQDV